MLTARTRFRRRRTAVAALVAALTLIPIALAPSTCGDDAAMPNAAAESRHDMLVGVGVVMGLPGTGDSVIDADAIEASIIGVLKRAGLEPWRDQIEPGRVAVVMLSAALPDGARDGTKIVVNISAIGDARSIVGGSLLVAPLRDADGFIHAIGQGLVVANGSPVVAGPVADMRKGELAQGAIIEHHAGDRSYATLSP